MNDYVDAALPWALECVKTLIADSFSHISNDSLLFFPPFPLTYDPSILQQLGRDLVRNVIQIGLVVTTWALAALATWFLLPNNPTYRIFDMTSGTVSTQVSGSFAGQLRRLKQNVLGDV